MKVDAPNLLKLKLIEGIIPEPVGGAHRDPRAAAASVKEAILTHVAELERVPTDLLLHQRYNRYRAIGAPAQEPVGAASN